MSLERSGIVNEIFTITKSDTTEMPDTFVGLYVGGTGDIAILTCGNPGRNVVFKAVPVGTQLFFRARRILSTNTTATLMLGYLTA
jgi:hypothetical protein